jgi:hypothetical protein
VSTWSRILVTMLMLVAGSPLGGVQGLKTEPLAADGGELGKAFVDLAAAFKAADRTRAATLLDPIRWHLDNKPPSWFAQISEPLSTFQPSGGRRQADRATLFLTSKSGYYGLVNATYSAGWRFDSPTPAGSSLTGSGRDCQHSPAIFPCGAVSAPDAQVSGTVQSHMIDPDTKTTMRPVQIFDGLAVRMVDDRTKAVQSTWVVLSGTGVNPQMLQRAEEPDQVAGWLNYPVLKLAIAQGGTAAKAAYYNGYSRQEFDLASGLTLNPQSPNRIRGTLKADVKAVASFNLTFDIGTASSCVVDKYQCGG